ncbi:hypothetical protein Tco_0473983 [Tanacetum coccineum]
MLRKPFLLESHIVSDAIELALSLEKLTNEKLLNPHEMQDRTKHKQRFDAKIAVADQTRLPFVTAENQFEARV